MSENPAAVPTARARVANTDGSREETSLLAFLSVLLKYRRTLALTSLIGALILAVTSVTEASLYEARASFVTRAARSASQAPGLMQQLGLAAGTGTDPSQTAVFYTELVKSKAILGPVSRAQYVVVTDSGRSGGALASFYGFGDQNPAVGAARVVDELLKNVDASLSSRTGIVIVKVKSIRPELASQIASNILAELNAHTVKRRRGDAIAERAFVEQLLGEALARLRISEEDMGRFREMNRDYENSAQLRMQNDRLARAVSMQQEIYTRMAGAYEQARIEEARDLSPITIVEPPETPVSPETGTAVRKTLLGLITGLLVGIIAAFLTERMRETRAARTPALAELRRQRAEALAGLATAVPFGRLLGRRER